MDGHNFIAQLGLEKLSNEQITRLSNNLRDVVLSRVTIRLEAMLSAAQIDQIKAAGSNDERALALIYEFLPDFTSIVNEEVELVKKETIDTQSAVLKKLGY